MLAAMTVSPLVELSGLKDCKKTAIFTAKGVKRINMRDHAKFRTDRSNCYRDIAIFHFFSR